MHHRKLIIPAVIVLCLLPWLSAPALAGDVAGPQWQILAPRLEFALWENLTTSRSGSSRMALLRVDPKLYDFKVLAASKGEDGQTAGEWREQSKALAVFNAGLYTPEGRHLGYLLQNGHELSPLVAQQDGLFLAGPREPDLPQARILDMRYTPFDPRLNPYQQAAQSLMLLDRFGMTRVRRSAKVANRTALAIDDKGRILVVVTEGGHTLWEMAQALKNSGLALREVMTMDGGAESQLAVAVGDFTYEHYGRVSPAPDLPWVRQALPAVLAVFKKK
ncbi:MAG: phosphodiester glycosidase family protein [Deltaproteobacteria bacterium]|nr:phosphodiester glycosidase family protein [Deltaproteobacteria bacterium]